MVTSETPEPSRSAKEAAEIAVLGATVIAIVLGFLILGGDLQVRIQVAVALTVALLIVAFAYARGFERTSVALRERRGRTAIARNPDLVRRLDTLVEQAGETFASAGKIHSLPNA